MNKMIAVFVASASAVQLDSIPPSSLMQSNPSYWKKTWPEGITDNSDNDDVVINMFLHPKDHGKKKPVITYPYTLSEDVISTQASIKKGEEITKKTFENDAAHARGLDMLHTYDNKGNVMEQDLPYGATW